MDDIGELFRKAFEEETAKDKKADILTKSTVVALMVKTICNNVQTMNIEQVRKYLAEIRENYPKSDAGEHWYNGLSELVDLFEKIQMKAKEMDTFAVKTVREGL